MELPYGGKPPRLGPRGQALGRQPGQPGTEQSAIGRCQPHASGCGEPGKIQQIRLIGRESIAGRTPLGGQHFQKGLDMAGKPRRYRFSARGSGH